MNNSDDRRNAPFWARWSKAAGVSAAISGMAGKNPWGGTGDGDGDKADAPKPAAPRNPWATPPGAPRPPRGGNRGPSALDELLKRGREGFGGGNGGGGAGGTGPRVPGNRQLWTLGIIAFVVLWLASSTFHVIPPEKEGVVTRLGSYVRTVGPGIQMTLPAPLERMQTEDVRAIRVLKIGATNSSNDNFVLTGDQNLIDLAYEVGWTVRDPEMYLFQIADQQGTIQEVAESAMRATLANFTFNQAVGPGRSDIEIQVQRRMQELLDQYKAGVAISRVTIKETDPPKETNEAFQEVNSAQQERESNINNSQAYAQQVLERARGDTSAFDKIYEQYRLAPEVTKRRLYYETMENVLSTVDKTIVETGGVTAYLPLPEIQRRAKPLTEPATSGGTAP